MPLFFVEHKHTAETCPTKNREMMLQLGQHVTQANADTYGIRIVADVVHPGEHWMNMVLESETLDNVERYMQPFGMVGSVNVKEVTTCEHVVETSTC